jgi:hypothetical protein
MPAALVKTISPERFEGVLGQIVQQARSCTIVLQPILLIARGPQGAFIGKGSVLVSGLLPETIEVAGYELRSVDPVNLANENRRFIDILELLLDRTGLRNIPGITITIQEVRNPANAN